LKDGLLETLATPEVLELVIQKVAVNGKTYISTGVDRAEEVIAEAFVPNLERGQVRLPRTSLLVS
jgi:hypothetical protein